MSKKNLNLSKLVTKTLLASTFLLSTVALPIVETNTAMAASNTSNLKTTINSKAISLRQPAIFQDGQVLIPMSDIFKAFGADSVTADSKSKSVTAVKGKTVVKVFQNKKIAIVNGKTIPIPTETRIINGRTMVSSALLPKFTSVKTTFNKNAKTIDFKGSTVKITPKSPTTTPSKINKDAVINSLVENGYYKHTPTLVALNIYIVGGNGGKDYDIAVDLTDDSNMNLILRSWDDPIIPESAIIPDKVKFALDQIIPSGAEHIFKIISETAVSGTHKELGKSFTYDGLKTKVTFREGAKELRVIFSK